MKAVARPVFDPEGALGWRNQALDGLNCVLRCVEAVLRWRGLEPHEVARALSGPLDPVDRDLAEDFDGCRLTWHFADDDGARNWPFVLNSLAVGEPVVVMPDRFHVPGDVYQGRFHFHDHAVLAVGWDAGDEMITVLDTDAAPAAGFRRRWGLGPALPALCTRVTTVTLTGAPDRRDPHDYLAERLDRDTALLATGTHAFAELLGGLRETGVGPVTARALHVLMLGHLQPLLFVFAHALSFPDVLGRPPGLDRNAAAVRRAALGARIRAMRLGVGLIAAHEQRDPAAHYPRVLELCAPLVAALERLVTAMTAAGGDPGPSDPEAFVRLRARLAGIERTCFPVRHRAAVGPALRSTRRT
ncbi:MAG: hypothetical protein ACRDRI_09735 [Pseudonocardiaceae bacterium]